MRAVVDLGSNTIKFLVAEYHEGTLSNLRKKSELARLGAGLAKTKTISPESLKKADRILKGFAKDLRRMGVIDQTEILATAAVRDAKNAKDLEKITRKYFSKAPQIISGTTEARLSMKGSMQCLDQSVALSDVAFLDIGGASTELGALKPRILTASFGIGAVKAMELFDFPRGKVSDPLWRSAKTKLEKFFSSRSFAELKRQMGEREILVAAGGTLLQAAKSMGAKRVNPKSYQCTRGELKVFANELRKLSIKDRMAIYGVPEGRADIMPSGLLVVCHLMKELEIKKLLVSSWGIRHGFLLNLLAKKTS